VGVTINDYVFREELSNSNGSQLESNLAKKNGLVIIEASDQNAEGRPPELSVSGTNHARILDHNSSNYQSFFDSRRNIYRYWFYPYYNGWYWYWYYSRIPPIVTRCVMVVPSEDGTIRATASGLNMVDLRVRVFDGSFSPDANFQLDSMSYASGIETARIDANDAFFDVKKDDVLVAMGTDTSPQASIADITYVGPAFQELDTQLTVRGGFSTVVKILRIKADGQAKLTYINCNDGRFAKRLIPATKERVIAPPVISEPQAFFKVSVEQDAFGNFKRPDWFRAVMFNLRKNDTGVGLRRRWTYENTEFTHDEVGRLTDVRTRVLEQWAVPQANAGQIGAEAVIYSDFAEAEADRLILDARL